MLKSIYQYLRSLLRTGAGCKLLPMGHLLYELLTGEGGRDLIEYTLLMAFVALTSGAFFLGAGASTSVIWTTSNIQLSQTNAVAS